MNIELAAKAKKLDDENTTLHKELDGLKASQPGASPKKGGKPAKKALRKRPSATR
jgi:hypothetical protein